MPLPLSRRWRWAGLRIEELERRDVPSAISDAAFPAVIARVNEANANFFVYRDSDSGDNHGFASGKFASNNNTTLINALAVDPAAINDSNAPSGVTTSPTALDRARGTVLRVQFPALSSGQFVGLNFEDPEFFGTRPSGVGYNLTGATDIVFEARSPTPGGLRVQFGAGGRVTDFNSPFLITNTFETFTIPIASLRDANTNVIAPPDLSNVQLLFSVSTNAQSAPNGGIILLDNVRYSPTPSTPLGPLPDVNLPLSVTTFGVVPATSMPIPPDQAVRNLTTVYESSLVGRALLARGTQQDLAAARRIADAFVYALQHDNQGAGLPLAPDGSRGLHDGFSAGTLALLNNQDVVTGKNGLRGQVKLAGFSGDPALGSPNGFYLVQDGATGGNNAFAVMYLVDAYLRFRDGRYLQAAEEISNWIVGNLLDASGTGFGGYFLGFAEGGGTGATRMLQRGKSVENNADIFAALTRLAAVERSLGNTALAAVFEARAKSAGDFVMRMFNPGDPNNGSDGFFFAGTLPAGSPPGPGLDPTGPQQGNDVINRFLFLDSDSFPVLALAGSPLYRNAIDWREPTRHMLATFAKTAAATGNGQTNTFAGFSLVTQPTPGVGRPNPGADGIAWEFTGQAVEVIRFVDQIYGEANFAGQIAFYLNQLRLAQTSAPFTDGATLPGSTLQGENDNNTVYAPVNQGLSTPFQVIPERPALAATLWAVFADLGINPFVPLPTPDFVVFGSDRGSQVIVQDARSRAEVTRFDAFPGFPGGVSVATGHVTADEVPDVVVGTGPGGNSHVKVFDGATGAVLFSFLAFEGFNGPVSVAAGDLNGDGRADVIVGAPVNGHVKAFDGATGALIRSFLAFEGFNGSVTVGAGDLNGDHFAELIVGAAVNGHVKAFDGLTHALVQSFLAYEGFSGGIFVAGGDLDGDGRYEIITGAGSSAPHVKAFDGLTLGLKGSLIAFAGAPFGVRVGATDVNGDGIDDILASPTGAVPHVKYFAGPSLAEIDSFFALDPALGLGVFVGGSA